VTLNPHHGYGRNNDSTMNRTPVKVAIIVIATALVDYLNLVAIRGQSTHVVLDELYYLPMLLGVVWFGLKGGIATYLLVTVSYLPFLTGAFTATVPRLIDRLLHLVATAAFVIIAGLIAERDRKRHEQAEQDRYFAGIGQASTVIVHDLKNPLISIQGFARRILQGKGDTGQAARVIMDSALTMQRIVNDVLEFARPIRLDLVATDVSQCIRQACDSCLIKSEEHGVTLTAQLPPDPVTRDIDSYMFQRALVNLINNAVEASPSGEEVSVSAAMVRHDLWITIRDQGSCMERETLDNPFTLTYTTKTEGTGFGVPIAKKIIEAHGGRIRIESRKGWGTEVVIELPGGGTFPER